MRCNNRFDFFSWDLIFSSI